MLKLNPPKIVDGLAKFDGRKKKYVPYPEIYNQSSETEKLKILVFSELQTLWERLQKEHPGNIRHLKSVSKFFQLAAPVESFIFKPCLESFTSQWPYWNLSPSNFHYQTYENLRPISDKGYREFHQQCNTLIAQKFKTKRKQKQAGIGVNDFIEFQNQHFMLAEHFYPIFHPPKPSKPNPLTVNQRWIKQGKQLKRVIRIVHDHWYQTKEYSSDEILGWLIFSGIVYGGINESNMLKGWLVALLEKDYKPFINQRTFISARFEQKYYGNERSKDGKTLFNTKQIIIDLVSQCWLMRYHQQANTQEIKQTLYQLTDKKLKDYLANTLKPVLEPFDIKVPTLATLLYYASYHWELLDNVDIDQASVTVLRGRQNTSGLSTSKFDQLLNQNYKPVNIDYDLKDIIELNISESSNTHVNDDDQEKIKVRKSDLISKLTEDFKLDAELKKKRPSYKPPTLIQRVERRCNQYKDLSETVLLNWILSLLKQKKPPSNKSILKYIKAIGYEWLYFTMGQAIDTWEEEDFEILYEDIIEYKAFTRGNKDLGYSAKLFNRMHNFASDKYQFPKVTIEYSQKGRRVRSELISPQAYKTIINQILVSVNILERDMLALIFILAYRTGMRKKEILGLKFNDIEGLPQSQPSIVIRPNNYRSTKTQSSIRRIPIFALLNPDELALFLSFIQSNIGTNSNRFIFTLSSDRQPLHDHAPLQLFKRVLKDITIKGDPEINHTFHGFRHTAVTNLSLVLMGHKHLIQSLTDYDEEDVLRIKHGLMGEHIDAQDTWYALAGIMGHLSPQRSFEYYNHIASLMATYELSEADIKLPTKTINNITGINYKQLSNNQAIIDNKKVSLLSIRLLLFRRINHPKRKSPVFAIENMTTQNLSNLAATKKDELFMRYGINTVEQLLSLSDKGIPLNEVATILNINYGDAQTLAKRAYQVANITNTRGKLRFIKPDFSGNTKLSPLSVQEQNDYRLLTHLINNAIKLRTHSDVDWQWFIKTCSQKITVSKAYISFSQADNLKLKRFIDIATELLPAKSWLISCSDKLLEKALSKSQYKQMRYKKNNSTTIRIGIANEEKRSGSNTSASSKRTWKYSPLLRYFVHLMLVMDDGLPIDEDKP
ncbi:tyrosine-type recombinase/integrase [uncultured Psychrobacter sp.]|uniref:tyrosine-type recombinase/integrase n=1 Tax=uncultured Psychrobacter sp. TaxID=259303 RepID=UPI002636C729|nr:tyrosine-type recombinase/integrase [uncultured Psychrobacter sp.]